MVGVQRAFSASKRMQTALGYQGPVVPFVAPPAVSEGLTQLYKDGLQEDEDETNVQNDFDVDQKHYCYEELADDGEDNDLPGHGYEERISDKDHAAEGSVAANFEDVGFSISGKGSVGEYAGSSCLGGEHKGYEGTDDKEHSTEAPSHPLDGSYISKVSSGQVQIRKHLPSSRFRLRPSRQRILAAEPPVAYNDNMNASGNEVERPSLDQYSSAVMPITPLFPLGNASAAYLMASSLAASLPLHPTPNAFFSTLFCAPPPAPNIVVTKSISPLDPRKRLSRDFEESETLSRPTSPPSQCKPAKKKHCGEPIPTGLSALPKEYEWAWKDPFPGNTEGISYNLLTWHATMRNLHANLSNPALMPIHPVSLYPPTKPLHISLASASFWDTGVEPHKELWFVGPRDVEVLSYNEVDTFSERKDMESNKLKQASRLNNLLKMKIKDRGRKRKPDTTFNGDGRWCFIVIRSHDNEGSTPTIAEEADSRHDSNEEAEEQEHEAPYVILAFPKSAVTRTTECLHTLYPDCTETSAAENQREATMYMRPRLNRVASMPALYRALATPCISKTSVHHRGTSAQTDYPLVASISSQCPEYRIWNCCKCKSENHLHYRNNQHALGLLSCHCLHKLCKSCQSTGLLRHFPSISEPPSFLPITELDGTRGQPWTLRRTILWFDKAGQIPLIEGYRTDLAAWIPFLEAVGRGEGKIILFCEIES